MSVVIAALQKKNWTNRKLLVACSGGVDSIVLLHALVKTGLSPSVLHVNYQLRGSASDEDEALVVKTAKTLGLEYSIHRCPVELTKAKGINLQAAARDFRRKLFTEWTEKSEDHFVVLGHHLDDQLETFFLQYFRGSGLFGLGGMHPEKEQLLRPFLEVPKADLIAFATENNLEWREDASNETGVYLRNVFRNQLLPALKIAHPDLAEYAAVIMSALRDLQAETLKSIESAVISWNNNGRLSIAEWNGFSEEQKLAFAHALSWPFWSIDRLNTLADGQNGNRAIVRELVVVKEGDVFTRLDAAAQKAIWDFKIEEVGILPDSWSKDVLYLDAAKVGSNLRLRFPGTGDRIKSIGVNGSQLVSNVLKDAKIPASDRKSVRLLVSGTEVLWIPGIKVSRIALATPASETIWKITV